MNSLHDNILPPLEAATTVHVGPDRVLLASDGPITIVYRDCLTGEELSARVEQLRVITHTREVNVSPSARVVVV